MKPYDPAETEPRIYKLWEESGFFNPDTCIEKGATAPEARPFTIIMPPPNVTGILHMGHALMLTLEDIMIRYKRMRGLRTLWLPGTDHAAIATQARVEKDIYKKEGKSRRDLGREEFLRRVEQFAKESHDTIVKQIRVLGASCDWSREAFTLDEPRSKAVNTMFKLLYDAGLIYRANRIVNWDPKGQTTISDDEIVYEERETILYTFRYAPDFPIAISTTRPETKVGDTAVAVHPDDERYKDFINKTYEIQFCNVPLSVRVVADLSVDPSFGTGAVGVTPAHSMADWEIADRHKLSRPQVISEYARMTVAGELHDKKTLEAREIIINWLRENKLLTAEEKIKHNIATAERTGGIIEPLPKLQWFISVNAKFQMPNAKECTFKELMREPVANGKIKIIPDHFEKTYFHWIDNLRDWCISRQIWYGHRVPVWYHEPKCVPKEGREDEIAKCQEMIVSETQPLCQFCNAQFIQDEDTLDTWFSSGLWTFSTLGWPFDFAQGKPISGTDLATYHPTDVLETGYEILFFWVARMILMTGFALDTIPFHTVYLHGTVRDSQGRKMSKSLGNGIDPIDVAAKFGADAGRMALIVGNTPGTDTRISEDKIKAYKHFTNKLWNIARFVLQQNENSQFPISNFQSSSNDSVIRQAFEKFAKEVTEDMENYRFYLAAEKLYHYVWHTLADKIIEDRKKGLVSQETLNMIFRECLILLHPFMPFVTEEIWGSLPDNSNKILMIERWPTY